MAATKYTECGVPFQSSELGPLPPHPQGKLLLPTLGPRGETHSLGGGVGDPAPTTTKGQTRGQTHSGTLNVYYKPSTMEATAIFAYLKFVDNRYAPNHTSAILYEDYSPLLYKLYNYEYTRLTAHDCVLPECSGCYCGAPWKEDKYKNVTRSRQWKLCQPIEDYCL